MTDRELLETISKKIDAVAENVRTVGFRADKTDATLTRIDERFTRMDERFDRVERNMQVLLEGVNETKKDVREMSTVLGGVMEKVFEHDDRIGSVEARVDVLEARPH